MKSFIDMSAAEREVFCVQAAALLEPPLPPAVIEKDFWVCWALSMLLQIPALKNAITFKGGTSLSKGWGLIDRFSEDIDLAVNRSVFGFEPPLGPEHSASETQRKKRLDALERQSHEFIKTVVVPQLEDAMGQHIVPESFRLNIVQKKGQVNVLFDYPGTLKGELVGVLPDVLIELVPRADDVPNQVRTITPTLYEVFPEILGQGSFEVPVLLPERTFLEKLFFIHESLLGLNPDSDRKSRHYYDLHKMYQSGVFDRIKASPELIEVVIAHRKTFFRYNNLDYDRMLHFGVGVVPSSDHLARWRADYAKTIDLIYHDRPSFDDLLVFAQKLEYDYNTWIRSRSGFAGS
jgi:hypothetical protein